MKLKDSIICQPKAPAVVFRFLTELTIMLVVTVKVFSYTDFCINKTVLLSLI